MSFDRPQIPKSIKRKLRELVSAAYAEELRRELEKLAVQFDEWRAGTIESHDLTDLIHKFHQGPARRMYSFYQEPDIDWIVGNAVFRGFLKKEDIPPDVWPYIERAAHVSNDQRQQSAVAPPDSDAEHKDEDQRPEGVVLIP